MTRQTEHALMFLRPALGDKLEIKISIRPVNLVADHRMPELGACPEHTYQENPTAAPSLADAVARADAYVLKLLGDKPEPEKF